MTGSHRENTKESPLTRLRRTHPGLDHLVRAHESFGDRHGNHYAAAITYFSVLSIVPILMVAFSVLGFVVAGNQAVFGQIENGISHAVPAGLNDVVSDVVAGALQARGGIGIVGLLLALYSGVGWMGNLRDALSAQWGQARKRENILMRTLKDLAALAGLGLALIVSFGLTATSSGVGDFLLRLAGLAGQRWAHVALVVVTVLLTLVADWLVFLWVFSRLPRERVATRSAVTAAAIASIGFLALQHLATFYLASVSQSAGFAVFGPVLGLLVFANLVARFLLYVTAWAATSGSNRRSLPETAPALAS